jgi:ABC-type Fe3+/spermidine/putrescine transport system ATPase subunit
VSEATHVRLDHVSKRFGSEGGVSDISLEVPRGTFTTLLGPSGCGKTTTLRLIAGFYEAEGGDIFIGERRVNDVPVHRRKTAMVFQDYALFPHMSVADNVSYGLRLAKLPKAQIRERTDGTLRFLGLSGLGGRFPNQLSGGQQQRVALARALVMEPEVLLLDEPLSNLDAKLRVAIRAELIGIQRQLGITTIYVTHDQEEALSMSDWIAVMNDGVVVQWGRPWELYYNPSTAFLADFLGTVNLVSARVVEERDNRLRIKIAGTVEATDVVEVDLASGPVGAEALLSIRPETLRLVAPDEPVPAGSIRLAGVVASRTFLGHLMRYRVRVAEQEWLIDQPDPGASRLLDGSVHVLVNPARIHVISTDGEAVASAETEAGAMAALQEAGLQVPPELGA